MTTMEGEIIAEKATVLLYRFEEEGSIDVLQEALLTRDRINRVLGEDLAGSEKPPNINFSYFDQFLSSLKLEAEKYWEPADYGKSRHRVPKKYVSVLRQAIIEFERQLEMRRLIPKNSNPVFWDAFRVLRDQILRGILNIETIETVIQRIPSNVIWRGCSPDAHPPVAATTDFAPDDPISPVLPDGTLLPENYEDFLKLLRQDSSLIQHYRHKFAGYARQAKRNGDWKSVLLFAREVAKYRRDDIETLMLLAQGVEQVGNHAELRDAVTTLERVEVLARKAGNQKREKEARALRQSVRGKLSIVQRRLPPHHSDITPDLFVKCNDRTSLIYYANQARGEQNHLRAAIFSAQLVKRYGGSVLDLRHLAIDLEKAALYGAAEKVLERLQKLDPNEVDPTQAERLKRGIPRSYLDVTPEILMKCEEQDLVFFASQARRAGDFKSSTHFQRRLADICPEDVSTLMRLAGDLQHAGDLTGALEINKRIADLVSDPDCVKTTRIIIQELSERLDRVVDG